MNDKPAVFGDGNVGFQAQVFSEKSIRRITGVPAKAIQQIPDVGIILYFQRIRIGELESLLKSTFQMDIDFQLNDSFQKWERKPCL